MDFLDNDKPGKSSRRQAWQALFLYLALGACWVLAGDVLLARWGLDADQVLRYQVWKGWLYVLITGVLAWVLLQRAQHAERQRALAAESSLRALHHVPAGIAHIAREGTILWANARLLQMLGTSPEQVVTLNFRNVVPACDRSDAVQQFERLMAGDIDHYLSERTCHSQDGGQVRQVLCTITLVAAYGPEPERLVCVMQDMGELQEARAALMRSETRLRLALEGSSSGVWDWDMVRQHTDFSEGVARMLRYAGDDFSRDFVLRERLDPTDWARIGTALRCATASDVPFAESARLLCYDGEYRWFMARGQRHPDAHGKPERFSGVLTDLSDQREAQESQRLAAAVVSNAVEGVIVTDAQSRIVSVNASVTRLLGYTEAELLGQTPRILQSGRHDQAFYRRMWYSVQQVGHWQGEVWNRRKNGEVFPEQMALRVVRDEEGTVTHYVCMFTDISVQKAQQEHLRFLEHKDALTGLSNRQRFVQKLDAVLEQARASGEMLAVLLLNLDRFKDVNESYGHAVGDALLQHIAQQIRLAVRPGDLLGRMAGDELAVVARDLRHDEGAAAVARQLIAAAAVPWRSPGGLEVVAGVSVGICMFPTQADDGESLMRGAHAAVYGAKAEGRGAWCFFNESMTQAARERLELEARLRGALAQGHMLLHYQPQVDIASGHIVGAEALVRWQDPQEGLISPARFIPVAESSGVIGPLGEWVLHEACRQGRQWLDEGLPPLTIAVNVSARQFHLTDLVAFVALTLKRTGFPATSLELEITEGALAEQPEKALQVLMRLGELGLRLAVDDFGTGYSSLAHLKRFPIDVLKIDQGFVRELEQSADDRAISAAIIAMGHSLGMHVLAEGVETQQQLDFLRERGCDSYQGYLRSRPVPAAEFAALLREQAIALVCR